MRGGSRAALLVLAGSAPACGPSGEGPARAAGDRPADAPRPWFADVTAESGIDFEHDAGFTPEKHLPETMGAGAALADFDADGNLDVYLVQSGPMPVGPETDARRAAAPPNRLFLNRGGGRFADATERSGDAAHRGYGMGAVAADFDGDGALDLHLTCFGPDALLLGDGRGAFADATDAAGVGDPRWTTSAAAFDADADGDLDLYVAAYVQVDLEDPPWCGQRAEGWRSYCHPDVFDGLQDRFWRNRGDGTFADETEAAGVADSTGKGLGVVAFDLEGDGDLDLYVANDSVENRLWENRGDGTFADATLLSGTGVNGSGMTEAGMGVAAGDVDGDLDLDLYVTNFDDESNTLYANEGGGLFLDATARLGLEAPSRLPVGFGTVMEDLDGDGHLDLAVANGHILDNVHLYHDGKTWAQRAQLYVNGGGGRFAERPDLAGALGARPFVGRGLFSGDLDGDGVPDLLLTQCGGPAVVLRNEAARRPFLVVEGLSPGTRVEARTAAGRVLVRSAGPQGSYLGSTDPRVFLSAGGEAFLEIALLLPGGERRVFPLDPPRSSGTVRLGR